MGNNILRKQPDRLPMMRSTSKIDFDTVFNNVSDFLIEQRKMRNMSLTEMAFETGISASQLYKIESKQSHIGIMGLLRICLVFDVSYFVFLPQEENETVFLRMQRLLSFMNESQINEFYDELVEKQKKGLNS